MISFSALIITQGQEEQLIKCLNSLRSCSESWQLVLVANGQKISEELETYLRAMPIELSLIHSESVLTPGKARNLGLESCRGEWIFFMNEEASVLPHYWETILPILKEAKVDVVGGPELAAQGMKCFSRAFAVTLASPFCTGVTFSRYRRLGRKMVFADEEKLHANNLWVRREALKDIRFSEDYTKSEETLLLQKLSANHAGMFYHPKLAVSLERQHNIFSALRSSFESGFFRSRSLREKLSKDTLGFWLPAVFVILHLFFFLQSEVFFSLIQLYLGIILAVSLGLSAKAREIWLTPLVVVLHYFMVLFYGIGFIVERFSKLPWK